MWNNGQQQAAWWPTYTYSQFPVGSTQDEQVDESQQWAIRAAMWAQQKKMQEHFQQQMELYQEQAKKQNPKEDCPPLPPELESKKPPPPPDADPEPPVVPPAVPPTVQNIPDNQDYGRSDGYIEPHFRAVKDQGQTVEEPLSRRPDIHEIPFHREERNHLDERKVHSPFRKGHWKPFGPSEDRPEGVHNEDHGSHHHYHQRHHQQHHHHQYHPHHQEEHYMHEMEDGHSSSSRNFDNGLEHAVLNNQNHHNRREPFVETFHHQKNYLHEGTKFESQFFHQGQSSDVPHHPVPSLEGGGVLPPPLLEQPHNMEYFSALPQLPAFAFPPGRELPVPEPFPASGEETMPLPGVEISRKKGLPPWLREALEKLEKDKQKKQAKEKGQDDAGKSKVLQISGYHQHDSSPENSSEEDIENEEKETAEAVSKYDNKGDYPLENKASESSDDKDSDSEKEVTVNMMLRIKKMVTEVLLNVTNAEIKSIAFEVFNETKRKALNTADQLRSSGGLDALRNAMGSYGSSSNESSDDDAAEKRHERKLSNPFQRPMSPNPVKSKPPTVAAGRGSAKVEAETTHNPSEESSSSSSQGTSSDSDSSETTPSETTPSENNRKSLPSSSSDNSDHRKSRSAKKSRHPRESSVSSESESDSSDKKKKKARKRDDKAVSRRKNRKRSHSSSSESPSRRKKRREKSRKETKAYRRDRSSSDDRGKKRSRYREELPGKRSQRSRRSPALSKKIQKHKHEKLKENSRTKSKKSSSGRKDSKSKRVRSRSRSRSYSPYRRKR